MTTWPPGRVAAMIFGSAAVSLSPIPSRAPNAASASVAAWNRVMTAAISCIDMGPLLVRRIALSGGGG
jgi:hypothetical protein